MLLLSLYHQHPTNPHTQNQYNRNVYFQSFPNENLGLVPMHKLISLQEEMKVKNITSATSNKKY